VKHIPPQDFDAERGRPGPRRVAGGVLAREAAKVIDALAQKWTSWRRELGFNGDGE
jgi:hypothetical protein